MSKDINRYDNKLILADKPLNWTSAKVINKLKKVYNLKKAGHSGTLDPRATGLLIICTGKKTKIISEIIGADKEYEGVFRIGATTPTFDTESEEENIKDVSFINDSDIESAVKKLTGDILQTPPVHSAIKINGKPVYKLARKGRKVVLDPRQVRIDEFYAKRISETEIFFRVSVSKGTYIRSLADDFGKLLNAGAYLKELRRTRIGDFNINFLENDFEETEGLKFRIKED